jgi:protein-disulfide isomerase
VDEILEKYPNDVKVVIKNFPLGSHKQARKAAQYALAANKQGKFKEMFHKIFDDYKSLRNDEDLPKKIAAELGLDIAQLTEDMNSKEISDLIDFEYNQLASLRNAYPETDQYAAGVRIAVPKFFINGKEPAGRSVDQWSAVIEKELKK